MVAYLAGVFCGFSLFAVTACFLLALRAREGLPFAFLLWLVFHLLREGWMAGYTGLRLLMLMGGLWRCVI